MTASDFFNLHPGDIIHPLGSPDAYIVIANHGTSITAVRTVDIADPTAWDVVLKVIGWAPVPSKGDGDGAQR